MSFFKKQPYSNPHINACYAIEGLIPAYYYLRQHGHSILTHHIKGRLDAELEKIDKFQIKEGATQIRINKNTVIQSDRLEKLEGGFVNGESRPQLRIDFTQHCLSALLKAEQYLSDTDETTAKPAVSV